MQALQAIFSQSDLRPDLVYRKIQMGLRDWRYGLGVVHGDHSLFAFAGVQPLSLSLSRREIFELMRMPNVRRDASSASARLEANRASDCCFVTHTFY